MAAFNKFNNFVEAIAEKNCDLQNDALKIFLTNTAPIASNSNYADISANDLATANGYTAGGSASTVSSSAQTSGTYKLVSADVTFTATGAVGPFRYAVLYDSTPTNKTLIGWWDYGSSITLASGESFTVDLDGTNGDLQIA